MQYIRKDKSVVEFTTVLEAADKSEITIFNHFRNQEEYQIITLADTSISHEKVVVYKTLDSDEILVKKANNFFKKIDKNKYPNVEQEYIVEPVLPIVRSYITLGERKYITLDMSPEKVKKYSLNNVVNK